MMSGKGWMRTGAAHRESAARSARRVEVLDANRRFRAIDGDITMKAV